MQKVIMNIFLEVVIVFIKWIALEIQIILVVLITTSIPILNMVIIRVFGAMQQSAIRFMVLRMTAIIILVLLQKKFIILFWIPFLCQKIFYIQRYNPDLMGI